MTKLSSQLIRPVSTLICGRRASRALSILIYHRVLPDFDPLRPGEPTVRDFDRQMGMIRRLFTPLPLHTALELLMEERLPERSVCVTFDDGYADNEQFALPVLVRHGISATVFVSTGYLNGGRMWNDTVIESIRRYRAAEIDLTDLGLGRFNLDSVANRLAAVDRILTAIKHLDPDERLARVKAVAARVDHLPDDLMMTDLQVRRLAARGQHIGAHTVNHPILASVPLHVARAEIAQSKSYLEDLIQTEVAAFAYPNGRPGLDYTEQHRDLVAAEGFSVAVATHWGVGVAASDRLQLPRFTPWDRQPWRFALRLLLNGRRLDPLVAQ